MANNSTILLRLVTFFGLILLTSAALPGRDTWSDTWAAVDDLGRVLPLTIPFPIQINKTIGMFYFLANSGDHTGPWDNTKIMIEANWDVQKAKFGQVNDASHWGEPFFGFYVQDDDWVIRKHAQMMVDAGVDFICFDVTNAVTYDDVLLKIINIYADIRAHGGRTPYLTFIFWSGVPSTISHIYNMIYKPGLQPDLWFTWQGKPLVLANQTGIDPEIIKFFNFRESWAWTRGTSWFGNGKDRWPWIDDYAQGYGWDESPDIREQMPVAVGGWSTLNLGRSYDGPTHTQPPLAQQENLHMTGHYFSQQFEWALQLNCSGYNCSSLNSSYVSAQVLFVTGWNEWTATRFIWHNGDGPVQFLGVQCKEGDSFWVDEFDQEFSRDIEPQRGGHGDNYYYQLVNYVRYYKGIRPLPTVSSPKTITINDDFSQWDSVEPVYYDDINDISKRSYRGFGNTSLYYTENSTRDDLCDSKVARDNSSLYFYVNTCNNTAWLDSAGGYNTLYFSPIGYSTKGWYGYDYKIEINSSTLYWYLGTNWIKVTTINYKSSEGNLHLAVPFNSITGPGTSSLNLQFKWFNSDHITQISGAMDFMYYGDSAPNSRFNYQYIADIPTSSEDNIKTVINTSKE